MPARHDTPDEAQRSASRSLSRSVLRDALAVREIAGLGEIGVQREIAVAGSARAVLARRSVKVREAAYAAADSILERADASGVEVLAPADARYPERLRELHDAPSVLFAKGSMTMADAPAVAIVGTRAASAYGLRVARAVAATCAGAGATIISGLAQGIDGAAHEAALSVGGRTVAVLGTGVNVVFPRRHHALQSRMAADGLLLSELAPDRNGHGGTFPRRNRVIAALADVTVVVEAGESSGALITARHAVDLHRPVLCVPNAIDLPGSRGSNRLLKEFAEPLLSPDDVLQTLALRAAPSARPMLDGDAAHCWDAIMQGAVDLPSIAARTGLPPRGVSAAVTALELEALITIDMLGQVRTTMAHGSMAVGPL